MTDTNMEGVENDELPTSSLLGLPAELRLLIYDFLRSDTSSEMYGMPDDEIIFHPLRLCRLMQLPLLHVCRLIRHEAIPIWYDRRWLLFQIVFSDSQDRRRSLSWLRRVDPYALASTYAVVLRHRVHHCKTLRDRKNEATIMRFKDLVAWRIVYYVGGCCALKHGFDNARDALLREFKRKVEAAPETLKAELIRLVERLFFSDKELKRAGG